jgi:hypothetical protein
MMMKKVKLEVKCPFCDKGHIIHLEIKITDFWGMEK